MNNLAMSDKQSLGECLRFPSFIPKGWGYEQVIVNNDMYAGKLLHFVAGKRCSIHYHKIKNETFFLRNGHIEIYFYDDAEELERILKKGKHSPHEIMEKFELHPGHVFDVPVGRVHQMVAVQDSDLFEFSTTHFDSDSYRIIKGD